MADDNKGSRHCKRDFGVEPRRGVPQGSQQEGGEAAAVSADAATGGDSVPQGYYDPEGLSSGRWSLVPWQGSCECLLEGQPHQKPRHTFTDLLPQDTMLDRVLRCFEALHVLQTQEALVGGRQEHPAPYYWRRHHPGGLDNWTPDLFFRDFSLEEEQFPECEAGSVSSAASHQLLCPATSTASPGPSQASPSPDPAAPLGEEEEAIITPPEEFRGTPEPRGSGGDHGSTSGVATCPGGCTGEFRLMTESEYWRSLGGGPTPGAAAGAGEYWGSGPGGEADPGGSPECSLTNLEHLARAAYIRGLLSHPSPLPFHQSPHQSTSLSDQFTSASHLSMTSLLTSSEEDGRPADGDALDRRDSPPTVHSDDSVTQIHESLPQNNNFNSAISVCDSVSVSDETGKSNTCVTDGRDSKTNISIEDRILWEPDRHERKVSVELSHSSPGRGGGQTSETSTLDAQKSRTSKGATSDGGLDSDSNSGSTGTPPPVDFSTHPLSPEVRHTNTFTLSDISTSDKMSESTRKEGCSVPCVRGPRPLSPGGPTRFLLQMYPDSCSGSDGPSHSPCESDCEALGLSRESEKSEEVELFINNPESMVVSRVNIDNLMEVNVPYTDVEEPSTLVREGGGGVALQGPGRASPAALGSGVGVGDGWGVGAGPSVSQELLSLEGEEFVELLGALVGAAFQPDHHPRDDPTTAHPRDDPTTAHSRDDPTTTHPRDDPTTAHPRDDPPTTTTTSPEDDGVYIVLKDDPSLEDQSQDDPTSLGPKEDDSHLPASTKDEPIVTTTAQPGVVDDPISSGRTCGMYVGASGSSSSSSSSSPSSSDRLWPSQELHLPQQEVRDDTTHVVDEGFVVREFGCVAAGVQGGECRGGPVVGSSRRATGGVSDGDSESDQSGEFTVHDSSYKYRLPGSSSSKYRLPGSSSSKYQVREACPSCLPPEGPALQNQAVLSLMERERTRNVVATFNFHNCPGSSTALATRTEPPAAHPRDDPGTMGGGTTLLATYDFQGRQQSSARPALNTSPASASPHHRGTSLLGTYNFTESGKQPNRRNVSGSTADSVVVNPVITVNDDGAVICGPEGSEEGRRRAWPQPGRQKHSGLRVTAVSFHAGTRLPATCGLQQQQGELGRASPRTGSPGGVTHLATFNFLQRQGGWQAAAPLRDPSPLEDDLPSLTDSIVSLEDGKHLLAVFDFTKPQASSAVTTAVTRTPVVGKRLERTPNCIYSDRKHVNVQSGRNNVCDEGSHVRGSVGKCGAKCSVSVTTCSTCQDHLPPRNSPVQGGNSTEDHSGSEHFQSIELLCAETVSEEGGGGGVVSIQCQSGPGSRGSSGGEGSSPCQGQGRRRTNPPANTPHQRGERVVEVYGGVQQVPPHQTPAAPVGGLAGHVVDLARPHPAVDPAHLTSLDLESDLHHHPGDAMLVSDPPHPAYHDLNHDLNHNNHHVFTHKPPEDVSHVNGRAAKYVVNDSDSLTGHDNYAFESELSGQDNYGYDPGYSSERSPEEEEGPPLFCHASQRKGIAAPESYSAQHDRRSLKLTPGHVVTTRELMKLFPFINEGTVFEVTVIKNLRGLGLAVTGGIECDVLHAGLIRIKKLYPQTPAWLCGQLEVGDILLHANTQPLTGLSSHEALEMLRTAEREVTLEVCRPPRGAMGEGLDTIDGCSSLGVVTTSLIPPTTSHNYLSPSPSFSSFGEFEIELTKVAGSLGFTLRKQDNSILGHTIRSLVKEPAISDGRLRPGDKIISVNNTNMCNMSHEEAIGFLRTCPDTVTLKLYRDAMQTPVSPASPTEPDVVSKPKALRKEARDMLTDLAMRKQSPSNSMNLTGATSSPGTPRRRRLQKTPSPDIKSVVIDRWDSLVRKTEEESLPDSPTVENKISLNSIRETDHEDSPFGDSQTDESTSTTIRSRNSSAASSCSYTPSNSESSRPKRPSFLDLSNGRSCPRKTQFTPPHEVDQSFPSPLGAQYPSADSLDSAPQLTSAHSDTPAFSYLHQGYHSVNLGALHQHEDLTLTNTTSDHNISGHDNEGPSNNGLLKWKGIVFTPDEEDSPSVEDSVKDDDSAGGSPKSQKPKMVTLELNRGWNSRLGFSLQPQGDDTIITAIYADSVAAKDGRLRIGDIIVKVNDVDVVGWDSESVIDLLRKTRGKISLTVLQQPC